MRDISPSGETVKFYNAFLKEYSEWSRVSLNSYHERLTWAKRDIIPISVAAVLGISAIGFQEIFQPDPQGTNYDHSTTNSWAFVLFILAFFTSYLIWLLTISGEDQLSKYAEANNSPGHPGQDCVHCGQHCQAMINGISTSNLRLDVELIVLLTYIAQILLLLPGYALLVFTLDGFAGVILKCLVLCLVSCMFTVTFTPGSHFWVTITLVSHLSHLHSKLPEQFWQCLNGQLPFLTLNQPPNQWTTHDSHVSAANSIIWMIVRLADMEVIANFVMEVVWHDGIQTTPVVTLYDTLVFECFDHQSGHPVLIPVHRDKAYVCAKALLHIATQRKCLSIHSDDMVFTSISERHSIIGYQGDPELASVLGFIDTIFQPGNAQPVPWATFTFTIIHHAWISHILLYHAWGTRTQTSFSRDVMGFVDHSLRLETPPSIVADCILAISLFLGNDIDLDDLSVFDKSGEVDTWVNGIYEKLIRTFTDITSTDGQIAHAREAMEFIAPLSSSLDNIAQKSYDLFRVAFPAPPFPVVPTPDGLSVFSLAIRSAYDRDGPLPPVKDSTDILRYLRHAFNTVTGDGRDLDKSIQSALRALVCACDDVANATLDNFDPTQNWFLSGLCYVYGGDKPVQFRKVALHFLPRISNKLFATPISLVTPDRREILCANWVHTVNGIGSLDEVQDDVLDVLLAMLDSDHWRPHIILKVPAVLEPITLIPNPQPLRRCLEHPHVVAAIRDEGDPVAMANWLEVLLLNHEELLQQVLELVPEEQWQWQLQEEELELEKLGVAQE